MNTAFFYISVAATLAVAVVLIWGLSTLLRGNTPNLSQKLMRWRVGLQFIAILVLMLFMYLTRGVT
jgi:Hypoxia induced protein conserved region